MPPCLLMLRQCPDGAHGSGIVACRKWAQLSPPSPSHVDGQHNSDGPWRLWMLAPKVHLSVARGRVDLVVNVSLMLLDPERVIFVWVGPLMAAAPRKSWSSAAGLWRQPGAAVPMWLWCRGGMSQSAPWWWSGHCLPLMGVRDVTVEACVARDVVDDGNGRMVTPAGHVHCCW